MPSWKLALFASVTPIPWSARLQLLPPPLVQPEYTSWRDEQSAWNNSVAFYNQSFHMISTVVRGKDAVMDLCRKLGKFQFLRQKEELNKEAILAEPEAIAGIKGLSISQTEEVIIKPFETELEEVAAR